MAVHTCKMTGIYGLRKANSWLTGSDGLAYSKHRTHHSVSVYARLKDSTPAFNEHSSLGSADIPCEQDRLETTGIVNYCCFQAQQ